MLLPASSKEVNEARRNFLTVTAMAATASALKAQEKKVDGGLAAIEDKKIPEPPDSHYTSRFVECTKHGSTLHSLPIVRISLFHQVLRPSTNLMT